MDMGGQRRASAALSPGKTRYPLYRRLGGPQGWSGQVRKISPSTGIRYPDRPARNESLYRLSYRALNKHDTGQLLVTIIVKHSETPHIAPRSVDRNSWRHTDAGGKSKYCTLGNFSSQTRTSAKSRWCYIEV